LCFRIFFLRFLITRDIGPSCLCIILSAFLLKGNRDFFSTIKLEGIPRCLTFSNPCPYNRLMQPPSKLGYRLELLLLSMLLAGVGCSKAAIKPSEDSLKIRAILVYVDRLRQTYQARDEAGLLDLISADSKELSSSLPPLVARDFQSFDRIELKFTVDRIELSKGKVTVVLNWHGQWQNSTTRSLYKDAGTTILSLTESPVIRLAELSGDPLFGAAARIAKTPPLSRNPVSQPNP
jgi:hypothetical protein